METPNEKTPLFGDEKSFCAAMRCVNSYGDRYISLFYTISKPSAIIDEKLVY
jgi:hypothetical protein